MVALHETAESVAASGLHDVVVTDGVAAGERPVCAKGRGGREDSHADGAHVLK
jgi:hypothetical protein